MIFHFVKIMDDLELFNQKTPKIRFDDDIFFGVIPEILYKKYGGLIGQKNLKFWNSRKLRYPKSRFFKDVPVFFLVFFEVNS